MGWVDLSTLYVNKSGDTMNGSLTVPANSSLICYNDTTSYNVGATLKSLQDSVSQAQEDVASLKSRPRVYVGSKVVTYSGYHYATLFTAEQVASIAGRAFDEQTDAISVCNGDLAATDYGIFAYISSGAVHLRLSHPTGENGESGPIRVNYALFMA